jgi:hypothetical protein
MIAERHDSPLPEGPSVTGASLEQAPQIAVRDPEDHLRELGPLSSHPRFALRRLALVQSVCLALALGTIALCVAAWVFSVQPTGFVDAIFRLPEWLDAQARKVVVVAVLGAFFLSLFVSATLQIRASFVPSLAERAGGSAMRYGLAAFIFCCFAAGIPYVVANQSSWRYALLIDILALAPLPIVATILEWMAASEGSTSTSRALKRLGVTFGMIALVVAPFMALQILGGFLRVDLAQWIGAMAGSLDLSAYVEGGSLRQGAPSWLREIADGRYGDEPARLLKQAVLAIESGTDGTKAMAESVTTAVAAPIERLARFVSLLLLLPAVAVVVGHTVFISQGIRASISRVGRDTATDASKEVVATGKPRARRGCWGWLLAPFVALFGGRGERVDAAATEDVPDSPDWLKELIGAHERNELPSISALGVLEDDRSEGTALAIEEVNYDWLFDGNRPTIDQHRALVTFRDRFERYVAEQEQDGFGGDEHLHPDFFLESRPGSGASTTLMALAMYAAATRGQRVLLLKSSAKGADVAVHAVNRMLDRMGLASLLRAERLQEGEVQRWCDATKHLDDRTPLPSFKAIPDILVGTLADWERICQCEALHLSTMRAALLGIEVVLVDDFGRGRGDPLESMHLPFSLDKHRLFLRSEFRLMQLVVACPILDEGSRELLSKRLFGGNGSPHKCTLRPWRAKGTIRVDATVRDGALESALAECVAFCTDRGLRTLVFRQDLDGEWVHRLRDSVRRHHLLETVSDAEHLPPEFKSGFSVIIHRRTLGEDPPLGVAAVREGMPTVYIRLAESAQSASQSPDPIPVLASARSRTLFFAHLRSIAAYLAPGAPVPRNDWVRFGMRERGRIDELECAVGEQFTRAPRAPTLFLDPPEAVDGLADAQIVRWDAQGVWPYVVVSGESTALQRDPINLGRPLEERARVYLTPDGRFLLLGESDRSTDYRRFAVWLSPRSEEVVGELDLAHADLLRIRRGDRWYRPATTESAKGNRDSRPLIRADFYHDEPQEPIIPVLGVDFEVEPHASVAVSTQFGIPQVEWYAFEAARRPHVATISVSRIADERGHENALGAPLEFELDVSISVLTVGMEMPERDREHWARAFFAGGWTTAADDDGGIREEARGFLPAVTAALQIALRTLMPDMLSFARVMAFRPPRGGRGVTVFFIEPIGTAGTALETMQTVLGRPTLRRRLIQALRDACVEIRRSEGGLSYSPRYEGSRRKISEAEIALIERLIVRLDGGRVDEKVEEWRPSAQLGVIRSPAPLDDAPWSPPEGDSTARGFPQDGAASIAAESDYEWNDPNGVAVEIWHGDVAQLAPGEQPVRYGVRFGEYSESAKADVAAFGYDRRILDERSAAGSEARHEYLQSVGFQEDDGAIWANYEWMVARSVESVLPLATRIVAQAEAAGARSRRARLSALLSFVASLKYEIPAELGDGRHRWEVRMPTDSLNRRSGDCDSMSVLFLSLVRALRIADGFVVSTHDHAMVALAVEIEPQDDYVDTSSGRMLVIECTSDETGVRRLGRVSRDLVGVSVTIER